MIFGLNESTSKKIFERQHSIIAKIYLDKESLIAWEWKPYRMIRNIFGLSLLIKMRKLYLKIILKKFQCVSLKLQIGFMMRQ